MKNLIKKIISFLIQNRNNKRNDEVLLQNGSAHFINSRKNYPEVKNLNELDFKVFSQSGEDGIIDYLLYSLNIKIPKFVEIGIGDYQESNTRFLFEKTNAKGLVIDCLKDLKNKISKNVTLWKGDLIIVEKFVNAENINNVLKENGFNKKLDLLSLDVDGIDYWILDVLQPNISKIIIVEYNSTFGSDLEVTVPNIKNFNRTNYHYSNLCFGASLKAIIKLMKTKNYIFLGTNISKINAFFISKEELHKIKLNLPNDNDLSEFVNSNIRESRSIDGKLSYLSGNDKIKAINNCEVINLKEKNFRLMKIKDIS